jgi:NAD(P)H-dependent FMN reductase
MHNDSFSTETLRIVLKKVNQTSSRSRLLDLNNNPLPIYYHKGSKDDMINVNQAIEMVNWADAFILATPDYHGSMSGSLKNFLDYFWSEFAGRLLVIYVPLMKKV